MKKSKKDCENKFALIPESELDNVMAGLQEYLKSWDRKIKLKDLQYIPSPLTWINRQSWNDEVIYDSETLSHIKANELRDKKIKREAEEEHEKIKNMQARKELDDKIKRLGDKERNDILSMLRNKIMKERPKIASNPKMLEYTVDAQFRTYIKNNY